MVFNTPATPDPNTAIGRLALQAIRAMIQHPFAGTSFYHYQAQTASPSGFNERGQPSYLVPTSGENATGVDFVANPANPLKGVFCPAPRKPYQDKGGIYYTAQQELYVVQDLGEVFALDGEHPKRQDKFVIHGYTYYACAPAFRCLAGDTFGLWRIDLNLERYPVKN